MIQIAGSTGSQKGHLAYALAREDRRVLYVVQDEEKAKEILEEVPVSGCRGLFLPGKGFSVLPCGYPGKISDSEEDGSDSGASGGGEGHGGETIDALMDGVVLRPASMDRSLPCAWETCRTWRN